MISKTRVMTEATAKSDASICNLKGLLNPGYIKIGNDIKTFNSLLKALFFRSVHINFEFFFFFG